MFSRDYYLQGNIVTTDLNLEKASLRLSAVEDFEAEKNPEVKFLLTLWCHGKYDFRCIFNRLGDAQRAFHELSPHATFGAIKRVFGSDFDKYEKLWYNIGKS